MPDCMNRRWKKIAFQLLRDGAGNAIAVCSAEYLHPDSGAAVSPTVTLANPEYQTLRSEALRLAEERGALGACTVVFLQDEVSFDHEMLEFVPGRVWDFAETAARYPVKRVAALLESGVRLDETGTVDGVNPCYEPAPEELAVLLPAPDGETAGVGDNFPDAFRAALSAGGVPDGKVACALDGFRQGLSIDALQERTGLNRWFLAELRRAAD